MLAILAGFLLLTSAVINENTAAPAYTSGEYDGEMAWSIISSPASVRMPKGTITKTVAALNAKPESIPQKLSTLTWRSIIFRICRLVIPSVLSCPYS